MHRESFRRGLDRIFHDRSSGSSTIAIQFCRLWLKRLQHARKSPDLIQFHSSLDQVIAVFPTMAVFRSLRDGLRGVNTCGARGMAIHADELAEALDAFTGQLVQARRAAGVRFAQAASRHRTLLTLSASGAVLEACRALNERLREKYGMAVRLTVVVCESRPAREGAAMARRIQHLGCRTMLIVDAAAGTWIDKVDAIVLGADWIDRQGFINKTGSLMLSELAWIHRKRVYVVGDTLRFRREIFPAGKLPRADPAEVAWGVTHGVRVHDEYFERVRWNQSHVLLTEAGKLIVPRHRGHTAPERVHR